MTKIPEWIYPPELARILMPSYCCSHPTCSTFLPARGYCDKHKSQGKSYRQHRHSYYDQHLRSPESKQFYNSEAWQRARMAAIERQPYCERCRIEWATTVHHIIPVKEATPAERLEQSLLVPLCAKCHNELEAEIKAKAESEKLNK